jgi:hypothetical protein
MRQALKADVRRLLAAILVADYRADLQRDMATRVASPEGDVLALAAQPLETR